MENNTYYIKQHKTGLIKMFLGTIGFTISIISGLTSIYQFAHSQYAQPYNLIEYLIIIISIVLLTTSVINIYLGTIIASTAIENLNPKKSKTQMSKERAQMITMLYGPKPQKSLQQRKFDLIAGLICFIAIVITIGIMITIHAIR